MKMRFFNEIAYICDHYDKIIANAEANGERNWMLLDTWGVQPSDIDDIREERDVLLYLWACQLSMAREKTAVKPELEVVERLFTRQLAFLERIHRVHAYNVNKHSNPMIRRKYKACRHYLFKFSLPAWYEKLPAKILTFEEKYGYKTQGDLMEEEELEILIPIPTKSVEKSTT